ncbi:MULTISPECIES: GGDEF domain-containing protein [unclassified Brevundimonas]|uniref:GGDEF domain-containing protein n=1 Tax=unclassified Brevundimonas TaxID=2622653 RepID=UPI0025C58579|nr:MULTISPECIES: GGDEF domain-containing protein [unclassified Brevundimonas]
MNEFVDTAVRGPQAFALARQTIDAMEAANVWPTPLNYELWLHYIQNPDSPLAQEMRRLLEIDTPFTDTVAEMLATEFLPRSRLSEEIRDAGAVLNRELAAVATAIDKAREVQVQYAETLADAKDRFDETDPLSPLSELITNLSKATRRIQRHTIVLERRLESSHTEVSKLRSHLEQVRRDAMTDALTNLANRKAFDEKLEALCAEHDEHDGHLSLAIIDIDMFKRFNDTWGHQTGDQVLRYVASAISRISQHPRIAARYGGEEFAVAFPGEEADTVETALNAMRVDIASRALRRRSTNDDLGIVTISAGVAHRHKHESPLQLMERADAALYVSKRAGRNRITSAQNILAETAA